MPDSFWDESDCFELSLSEFPDVKPYSIAIGEAVTLYENWVCFTEGPVDTDLLARMTKSGFDHAPVISEDAHFQIVSRDKLQALVDSEKPIDTDTEYLPTSVHFIDSYYIALDNLLAILRFQRAIILVHEVSGRIVGFLTVSDLSRPSVRRAAFELILDLESRLADLVDHVFPTATDWIRLLADRDQIEILGSVEWAKGKGVDGNAIWSTQIRHLAHIVESSAEIRRKLEIEDERTAKKMLRPIIELRNKIMHPVRPLALSEAETRYLLTSVETCLSLIARMKALRPGLHY